jgi:hypothetical protein
MPARKIPKNYRSVTGKFASMKNGRSVGFESILERDFFLMLEFDHNVERYEEQPIQIEYEYGNKKRRYTPDCLVEYKDGSRPCIVEIKYSDEIKDNKTFLRQKFDVIERYLEDNDMDFKVFTELDIRTQYLENIQFLYKFASLGDMVVEKVEKVVAAVRKHEECAISQLLESIDLSRYNQAAYLPVIWHLVFIGKLETDLNIPLTNASIVRRGNE